MLKAAIEKIQEMSKPVIQVIEGRTFSVNTDGEASEIRPTIDLAHTLSLRSLDALVKMIKTEAVNKYAAPFYIMIPDHMTVRCFAQPKEEIRNIRQVFYEVNATDVPGWEAEAQLGFEAAQIAMRTRFQETPDTTYALKLLSEISNGAKITFSDNGIATSVVTQKGVSLQTNESIRPIVSLKPYRTFQEVDQPASQFLIRINEHGISFIEADGGMWKLAARKTIKEYFDKALENEISNGTVIVAL
jgi:hypothetical protein